MLIFPLGWNRESFVLVAGPADVRGTRWVTDAVSGACHGDDCKCSSVFLNYNSICFAHDFFKINVGVLDLRRPELFRETDSGECCLIEVQWILYKYNVIMTVNQCAPGQPIPIPNDRNTCFFSSAQLVLGQHWIIFSFFLFYFLIKSF